MNQKKKKKKKKINKPLLKLRNVLPETLLALLTRKCHLDTLFESMRFLLSVTFSAVEPFLAARGANGDLCVENVFAGSFGQIC